MEVSSKGLGCFQVLTIIFIVLKVIGVIDWSWIWVLAPLWIPVLLWIGTFLALVVGGGLVLIVSRLFSGRGRR